MVNYKERMITLFIDYIGPFKTLVNKEKTKTYLILFKCFWSKAINIQVATSMDTKGF